VHTMAPRFSIITISYNHAEFIEDTIRSVASQDFKDVQHIVIDGGSTDGTKEILARYPHLEWISEPDRGISHALNKGFSRARGEIVTWLNADDWYAPGCLSAVSEAAKRHPIILGDAVETDRKGTSIRTIKNIPRGYFDVARYWVPMAWFAQPSVFFTRDLLEKSKLPNGDFFDESFRYSMDADLWLRLGEHAPFDGYIERVLSYFRVYGDNKTGRTFAAPRKELGRAFRRAYMRIGQVERQTALVLPINRITSELTASMASLLEQSVKDFELFIVDYSTDEVTSKSIREMVLEMEEHTLFGVKYLRSQHPSQLSAWNTGLAASRCAVTGFLTPGTKLKSDALLNVSNIFLHDLHGAALALHNFPEEQAQLVDLNTGSLRTVELLAAKNCFDVFFGRTLALREIGEFRSNRPRSTSVKGMIVSLLLKGWGMSIVNQLGVEPESRVAAAWDENLGKISNELRDALAPYEQSALVIESITEAMNDTFYPVRAASGVVRAFTAQDVETAQRFLNYAPQDFLSFNWMQNLQVTTERFPKFAPGWLALAENLKATGKHVEAQSAMQSFKMLSSQGR